MKLEQDPFEGATVVSTYTDEEAVDDGVLVAVGPQMRVTRNLFNFLAETLGEEPPTNWPVGLIQYAGASRQAEPGLSRAAAACAGLITTSAVAAKRVYDENIGGGIWKGTIQLGATGADNQPIVTGFDVGSEVEDAGNKVVWLMPNELGGLTLMFPSDY